MARVRRERVMEELLKGLLKGLLKELLQLDWLLPRWEWSRCRTASSVSSATAAR